MSYFFFLFLLYRIYNIVLSLSFPCFSVAGSTVANCKPNSPQLATVEPTAAKRKIDLLSGENIVGKLLLSECFAGIILLISRYSLRVLFMCPCIYQMIVYYTGYSAIVCILLIEVLQHLCRLLDNMVYICSIIIKYLGYVS